MFLKNKSKNIQQQMLTCKGEALYIALLLITPCFKGRSLDN